MFIAISQLRKESVYMLKSLFTTYNLMKEFQKLVLNYVKLGNLNIFLIATLELDNDVVHNN